MCSNVIWSRDFLPAQGYDVPPARVYQDNKSAIALEEKDASSSERTRHVHIRYYWVNLKDRIDAKDIEVIFMPTNDMIGDVLTKPLQGDKFLALRKKLLNWEC